MVAIKEDTSQGKRGLALISIVYEPEEMPTEEEYAKFIERIIPDSKISTKLFAEDVYWTLFYYETENEAKRSELKKVLPKLQTLVRIEKDKFHLAEDMILENVRKNKFLIAYLLMRPSEYNTFEDIKNKLQDKLETNRIIFLASIDHPDGYTYVCTVSGSNSPKEIEKIIDEIRQVEPFDKCLVKQCSNHIWHTKEKKEIIAIRKDIKQIEWELRQLYDSPY
ncbi:MAG: hypothetical protein FP824_06555 [Euryarchaeota archaeon]|nr:hypothetical protein [Euryarchaeota archaeon]MBU4144050.1 hypothetical protein [Candidatus Thermoplasmatota archaeon]